MKKYSKLLLSLIVSSLKGGSLKEVHAPFADNVSQSSRSSIRETLRSIGTSVALKKGNEISAYGTIYDWAAKANPFEVEAIFYNLFGHLVDVLPSKSEKIILSVINAKVKALAEKYKKVGVDYSKIGNLKEFYDELRKLQYSVDDKSKVVDRSSEIENKELINDPNIQKELSVLAGKKQMVGLVVEKNKLKLKHYVSNNTEATKTDSITISFTSKNFQTVLSGDVCELQFLNTVNKSSSVSKLKLGIAKKDLEELLGIKIEPSSSELKEHGKDFVVSNSEFTKNLFEKLYAYLNGSKDKGQNRHTNVNIINFMNKLNNISIRTVLGNFLDLNKEGNLQASYVAHDQVLLPKIKLSQDNNLFEFDMHDKTKVRTYTDFNGVEAGICFGDSQKYIENILLMFYYEQEAYKKQEVVLASEKTQKEKKEEIKKIKEECDNKIFNLQKENCEFLKNPVVQYFFDSKNNLHITQAALEKVMTGKRNLDAIKAKYQKIQKEQPNAHPNLPKSHKVKKTCCGC